MAESPREFAHLRAREIASLLARLRAGDPITDSDISSATSRADGARRRAVEAHMKAAERFLHTAEVHEQAAEMYEAQAACQEADHIARLRGKDNRAAAERRRLAADTEIRRAMAAAGGSLP